MGSHLIVVAGAMSTFINFLWFILLLIQSYLSLAEAFNWFPSVAKNDNNNDDSINGDDLASSFAVHRDAASEDPQLLSKEAAEARLFFNTTGTYNATSLALTAGSIMFVALNSMVVLLFLTPKAARKTVETADNDQEYEYYYDDNVRKRKKRSPDDEYYSDEYYEDDEEPTDVWGYVLNEAVKQTFGSGTGKDPTTAQSEGLLEKLFVGNAGLSSDPVYNWIMGFSALALFFHTFYTPYGKTSMSSNSGRRRRSSEMNTGADIDLGYDNNGYGYNTLSFLQLFLILKDLYEGFDYNDLDCQKKMICEVMKEPEYYGNVAQKIKTGFKYANYMEYVPLPDDIRELLDEYFDANALADEQKNCEEFFHCPYSIKDSVKNNLKSHSF